MPASDDMVDTAPGLFRAAKDADERGEEPHEGARELFSGMCILNGARRRTAIPDPGSEESGWTHTSGAILLGSPGIAVTVSDRGSGTRARPSPAPSRRRTAHLTYRTGNDRLSPGASPFNLPDRERPVFCEQRCIPYSVLPNAYVPKENMTMSKKSSTPILTCIGKSGVHASPIITVLSASTPYVRGFA